MADRIVVLNAGRVEQFGSPMELYHHPATKFVATFIGQPNMNLVPATVKSAGADSVSAELDGGYVLSLPVDGSSTNEGDRIEIGVRPEDVKLGSDAGLGMDVRVLERLGGNSIAYGQVSGTSTRFCASLPGGADISEGKTTRLTLNPDDCHAFDGSGQVLRRKNAPSLVA